MKHLQSEYGNGSGVSVKILKGNGGCPKRIVIDAGRIPGAFDKRSVVIDNDKDVNEMAEGKAEAMQRDVFFHENTPCLEAILLSILNAGKSFADKNSDWCKREFESKHISRKNRSDMSEYKKVFPRDLLDRVRPLVPKLDEIIILMTRIENN